VITDNAEQDERVVAIIAAFIRDAERMADLTADFLDQLGFAPHDNQCGWNSAFLLELMAVLRIRNWELAGIKVAIDPSLPTFAAAYAELVERLQSQPERFLRGETPYLNCVIECWWLQCAHPNRPILQIDVAMKGVDRKHLLTNVAQLLWRLRNLNTASTASEQ
jgi:hypothetical protein